MNFKRYYFKLFGVMQLNVGFAQYDIKDIIKDKKKDLRFDFLPLEKNANSLADPFIFRSADNQLNLLYEEFSMTDPKKHRKIVLSTLDEHFIPCFNKQILYTSSHTSYPTVFI